MKDIREESRRVNQFEATLQELAKEGQQDRLNAIAFLKHYKWEQLTAKQIIRVLKVIAK